MTVLFLPPSRKKFFVTKYQANLPKSIQANFLSFPLSINLSRNSICFGSRNVSLEILEVEDEKIANLKRKSTPEPHVKTANERLNSWQSVLSFAKMYIHSYGVCRIECYWEQLIERTSQLIFYTIVGGSDANLPIHSRILDTIQSIYVCTYKDWCNAVQCTLHCKHTYVHEIIYPPEKIVQKKGIIIF